MTRLHCPNKVCAKTWYTADTTGQNMRCEACGSDLVEVDMKTGNLVITEGDLKEKKS